MAITRKAGNWQQYLKVSCATVMAGALMVSCSGADKDASAGEEKDGKAKNAASSAAEKKWDTGIYETTYRAPFDEASVTDIKDGVVPESSLLAKNMPLPYELDPELNRGKGSTDVHFAGRLSMAFGNEAAEAGKAFDDKLQAGFLNSAHNDDNSREVVWAVVRYDSPETAKEAAAAYGKAMATVPDFISDPSDITITPNGFQPLSDPAYGYDTKYGKIDNQSTELATSYNEYVLLTWARVSEVSSAEDEQELAAEYLKKQVALLETLPMHKTDAGVGTNDGFTEFDPDGLWRYAVKIPKEYRNGYTPLPSSMNTRSLTARWVEQDLMSAALKAAGVETAFLNADVLMKARNAEAASSLTSALVSYDIEDGWEEYIEPQDLPNTRCLSRDDTLNMVKLQCYTFYDDFVAYGSTFYSTDDEGQDANAVDSSEENAGEEDWADKSVTPKDEEEAKQRMSQMLAAQLKIFEDAKKNPEGSEPKKDAEEPKSEGEKKPEDAAKKETEETTNREEETEAPASSTEREPNGK